MKHVLLYILCQLVCIPLNILGVIVVPVCLLLPKWPRWAWVWFNDEDGYGPYKSYFGKLYWLLIRNSVDNFKYVPGVFGLGRPLWYWSNQRWYAKAGWESNGTICGSAGSGKGY